MEWGAKRRISKVIGAIFESAAFVIEIHLLQCHYLHLLPLLLQYQRTIRFCMVKNQQNQTKKQKTKKKGGGYPEECDSGDFICPGNPFV
jgi:hypothetical protein